MTDLLTAANAEIDKRVESTMVALVAELYNQPDKTDEVLETYRERLGRFKTMRAALTTFIKGL